MAGIADPVRILIRGGEALWCHVVAHKGLSADRICGSISTAFELTALGTVGERCGMSACGMSVQFDQ
jgi:hypothetical protein